MTLDHFTTPQGVVLMIALLIATVTDVRSGKIPNMLTLPLWPLGIVMSGTLTGDWLFGTLGLVVGFAIHYSLWMLGVEKGGDAKLMIGLGALLGWRECVDASIWYAALYLPIGLGILALRGKLGNLVAALKWTVDKAQGKPVGERPEGSELRTAPVILGAGICGMLFDMWPVLYS